MTDGEGFPLGVEVSAGQAHESKEFEHAMEAARIPAHGRRRLPRRLAGDKGYSFRRVRRWLRRRRISPVIPFRSDQGSEPGVEAAFDRETYRRRNVIERCVGWLKESRRIATRFEELAVNYLAMLKLAIIGRYFRILFSDTA